MKKSLSQYEYKNIGKEIFLIYNFITEEECNRLLKLANEADWTAIGIKELNEYANEIFNDRDIDSLLSNGQIELPPMFDKIIYINKEKDLIDKIYSRLSKLAPPGHITQTLDYMQRYTTGAGLEPHIDEADDRNIKYGIVLYLQQAELGGEIYFVDHNVEVAPPARSMIIFKSDYLHGVRPVVSADIRYVITSFFYTK